MAEAWVKWVRGPDQLCLKGHDKTELVKGLTNLDIVMQGVVHTVHYNPHSNATINRYINIYPSMPS